MTAPIRTRTGARKGPAGPPASMTTTALPRMMPDARRGSFRKTVRSSDTRAIEARTSSAATRRANGRSAHSPKPVCRNQPATTAAARAAPTAPQEAPRRASGPGRTSAQNREHQPAMARLIPPMRSPRVGSCAGGGASGVTCSRSMRVPSRSPTTAFACRDPLIMKRTRPGFGSRRGRIHWTRKTEPGAWVRWRLSGAAPPGEATWPTGS